MHVKESLTSAPYLGTHIPTHSEPVYIILDKTPEMEIMNKSVENLLENLYVFKVIGKYYCSSSSPIFLLRIKMDVVV